MNKRILHILYFTGFLFAAHTAIITYINSSFISEFVGKDYVGIIFTIGAIIAIFFLSRVSSVLYRFGNFKTTITLLGLEILSLFGLAFLNIKWLIIPLFIIHYAILVILNFNFDVFVEHFSKDKTTGSIRGMFLTSLNIGWVISPIIAGFILSSSGFWKIYLISAIVLSSVFIIILFKFRNVPDNHYDHPPFWKTLKEVWHNKNIYKVFMSSFLMQFFFAWMVIYTPIYLNQYIGFGWDKIGIIFTVMLLPYILFEIPAGKLADKKFGEKEFLTIGFIITAAATAIIAFIGSTNLFIWMGVLFTTRIGASLIEIMNDTYFFKQIDDTDIHLISFFRNTKPMAYIIAPIIATLFLSIFDYKYLFIALAIIMLYGVRYSLTLKDTK